MKTFKEYIKENNSNDLNQLNKDYNYAYELLNRKINVPKDLINRISSNPLYSYGVSVLFIKNAKPIPLQLINSIINTTQTQLSLDLINYCFRYNQIIPQKLIDHVAKNRTNIYHFQTYQDLDLINILKKYYTPNELKQFLQKYPEYLEYL